MNKYTWQEKQQAALEASYKETKTYPWGLSTSGGSGAPSGGYAVYSASTR